MKTRYIALGVAVMALAASLPLNAASATGSLTVNATVAASAKLSLSASAVNFASSDPDSVSSIPGSTPVSVIAKGRTSTTGNITLTVQASDDLKSGTTDTIAASAVSWAVSGTGFTAGTLSKSAAVPVGAWAGSGNRSGDLTFALANSWAYATGSYSATANFTLTAP